MPLTDAIPFHAITTVVLTRVTVEGFGSYDSDCVVPLEVELALDVVVGCGGGVTAVEWCDDGVAVGGGVAALLTDVDRDVVSL